METPPTVTADGAAPAPQSNWFARNLKWIIPGGCLGTLLICGGCFSVLFFSIFGIIKSSDAYTQSLAKVQADARVQQALGTPIEPGFLVTGNINIAGSSGQANISYPVSGPNGSATVVVDSSMNNGPWQFNDLRVVEDATGNEIDLLQPSGP